MQHAPRSRLSQVVATVKALMANPHRRLIDALGVGACTQHTHARARVLLGSKQLSIDIPPCGDDATHWQMRVMARSVCVS